MVITLSKIIVFVILFVFIYITANISINIYFNKKFTSNIQNEDYIYIDGIRINFVKKGEGEPILLIHGFICSILIFENIIDTLSQNNTVFALDLIGFGFSDKRRILNYSRKNMGKLATKFMLKQGINKFILLGYSMGGEVALNMAYHYPENIKRLILVSSIGYTKPFMLLNLVKKSQSISKLFIIIYFKSYFIQKLFFKFAFYDKSKFDNKVFTRIYTIINHIPIDTFYKFILSDDSSQISRKIKFINVNTLILWGKNDVVVPLQYGKKLNNDIKNSTLVILDNCGHIPFLEKPKSFIQIVQNYILQKV
jgi:pimeloyl-ACP methyl ester carboxylesterase